MESSKAKTIEESLIIKQVEKICTSPDFKTKGLLCRFLSYIISEHLAGRGDNLKGYTIAVDVFNRDEDFDPGQDALVRINAGRLRRILDLYYLKEGKNDEIKIEIPKGGYNPKISLRRNADIFPEVNSEQQQKEQFGPDPGIAVLSFVNRTGQPENDYLAHGISEELSVELTKYEDLSVYNFNLLSEENSEDYNLKKLAKKRGVRFVVEGAIQKSDTQIKTLVRLVDLMDEKQIWAQSYTRELNMNNLFEIQESISKEIASIIGSEFGIILRKLTDEFSSQDYRDIHVYSAVLKYYHFQLHLSQKTGEEAYEALLKAHASEPESAVINALLGAFYGNSYSLDFPNADETYKLLAQYTERAFVLQPESLIVNATLVYKCFMYNEKDRFIQLVEKCLSSGLNTTLRVGAMAFYTCLYGDWERGKKILDNVMARNVGYPLYFHGVTLLYYYRKEKYDQALNEAHKYNVPAVFWSPMLRAAVYGQLGNMEMASLNINELLKLKPDFESKAIHLISIFVKEENLVMHILEGLRLAGMKI
jgi:adenylate cyclase